ncbi:MAG TPA: hypothetical protein VNQ31_08625 [Sphingomonadaceae bacterium]|nr:hypothetical protein [Sphingomonadaceae bacterium]
MTASACSRPPAPPALQHPPVEDLTCPAEPAAPPPGADETAALRFDAAGLLAGRACRDALARVCRWHAERGLAGVACGAPERR